MKRRTLSLKGGDLSIVRKEGLENNLMRII